MAATSMAVAEQTLAVRTSEAEKKRERIFFSGMAIAMALTCFAGFAPSYFLRSHLGPPQPLSGLLHLHGLAFTVWIVLLVAQTSFIAATKADLHRRFGIAGAFLAVAMMILGGVVAITRAQQGLLGQGSGVPPLVFLAIPLATLIVFPVLIGVALNLRRRVDTHKRLILLGTIEILTAAVGRLPVISAAGPLAFFGLADLFIVAIAIYDVATRGRVHSATLWGGLFLIASQLLRITIAPTSAWLAFASWLTGA